jgi:hypothetical protein
METLQEILANNPGAKADFDKAIADSLAQGTQKANERAEFASKFMTASYPASIQSMAAKVIAGSAMKETLEAMVSMHDEKVASEKTQIAQEETEKLPETSGQSNGGSESLDKEQAFQARKQRLGFKK